MKRIRELTKADIKEAENSILTRDTESTGSYLIPSTILDTINLARRRTLVFRPLAAMIIGPSSIPGSAINLDLQDPDTMFIHRVGEGADIPNSAETYSQLTITPAKYAGIINITSELIEDSKFAVMEMNVKTIAFELAKNEDSLVATQLATGAAVTHTSPQSGSHTHAISNSTSTLTISEIVTGYQYIVEDGYMPDYLIVGVECMGDIMRTDTFVEADKAGVNDPSKRLIGVIYGMKVVVSSNITATKAYLIDSTSAFVIAEKRPVTLKGFESFIKDMKMMSATQRVAASYYRCQAIAEITTT